MMASIFYEKRGFLAASEKFQDFLICIEWNEFIHSMFYATKGTNILLYSYRVYSKVCNDQSANYPGWDQAPNGIRKLTGKNHFELAVDDD